MASSTFFTSCAPRRMAFTVALFACASCGAGTMTSRPTLDDVGEDKQELCKQAKDPLNPLIVEWPGTNKVRLDAASRRGVVVVAFNGCKLDVLTQCEAPGAYEMEDVTPIRDKVEIKSENDLFAYLPLSAVQLGGQIAAGDSLLLDYVAVGQRAYKGDAPSIKGTCDGATHFVKRIMVGAYSLETFAAGKANAGVNVAGAGVGASHTESDKRSKGSGDPNVCEKSPKDTACAGVIQLELTPLPGTPAPPPAAPDAPAKPEAT